MRYTLEKYNGNKSRFDCPNCQSKKTFTRYIDIEINDYLGDHVGICNKIDKCGYHFKPKQFFDANSHLIPTYKPQQWKPKPIPKPMFTVPKEMLINSLDDYNNNEFFLGLVHLFGINEAQKLAVLYGIGTSNKTKGATIFWQIDVNGIIRTGKIMLYDWLTLKRCKELYNSIKWVHTYLIINDTHELKQCFFGEHLINQFKSKDIAIVESEKTAIICSYFIPQYNWLGAGNINGLTIEKFKVLKGRKVVLFPDLNKANEIWTQKANLFKNIAEVSISNYLERIATNEQKSNGLDLADYLIKNVGSVANVA